MRHTTILIGAEDGTPLRGSAALAFRQRYHVIEARNVSNALAQIRERRPDVVVLEAPLYQPIQGIEAIRAIRQWDDKIPIILVAAQGSEALAVAAFRAGVTDYFNENVLADELLASVGRSLSDPSGSQVRGMDVARGHPRLIGGERMIGRSGAVGAIKAEIAAVAPSDSNALITGETGTGKELAAELIHRNSRRCGQPLVCINCAAIPDTLVESELFGYERGAFTGAQVAQQGKLQLGNGGTVFFDEIGDMSLLAQAKLLRVIESREIFRLGARAPRPIDVRFVAATNQDLERLVGEGKFRHDLYFRLNVIRIEMPPLRERREDIPLLVRHFVQELNRQLGLGVVSFATAAMERLLDHSWPGNIRELRNLVEAIFVRRPGTTVTPDDLPPWLQLGPRSTAGRSPAELDRLLAALTSTNWNKSRAAEQLHWSRMTLYRKLAKYKIAGRSADQQSAADPGAA